MQNWLAFRRRTFFKSQGRPKSLPEQYNGRITTPGSAPEFTIPQLRNVRSLSEESSNGGRSPCSDAQSVDEAVDGVDSPGVIRHPIDLPERARNRPELERWPSQSSTNSDPLSMNALSLPHLRTTTTIYGFRTLSEQPRTRRKESLFHSGSIHMRSPSGRLRTAHSLDERSPPSSDTEQSSGSEYDPTRSLVRKRSSKRRNVMSVVSPLGVVLPSHVPDSPCGCPSPDRLSPVCSHSTNPFFPQSSATEGQFKFAIYDRRARLSLLLVNSSRPTSPQKILSQRKGSYDFQCRAPLRQSTRSRRASSVSVDPFSSIHALRDETCTSYGKVKLSIVYQPLLAQLQIVLLRADRLAASSLGSVNAFAKLSLSPGKVHKYKSKVVKGTCYPTFYEELVFSDLSRQTMHASQLLVRFYHKTGSLRRNLCLGEAWLALGDINTETLQNIWLPLESPDPQEQSLGQMQVALTFRPFAQLLIVNVIQARGLRIGGFRADATLYVKLEITQPGREDVEYVTKPIKNSASPYFAQLFSIELSPKIDELTYSNVTLTLFHERHGNDIGIGQVRFGMLATEVSECTHWNRSLQNPDANFTQWHTLMDIEKE